MRLTYCTNVHPAETVEEIEAVLERYAAPVKAAVSPDRAFGLGLRWSDEAARRGGELDDALRERGLYAFTVNGFVHGGFQVDGLKEGVYAPPWEDPERVAYTLRCADGLAGLMPEGAEGSLSTVAGTYRPWGDDPATRGACAEGLVEAVRGLVRLRDRTGRTVRLAVEPEPWTTLETTSDAVRFWDEHVRPAARAAGLREDELSDLLGLCFDACHLAVMFEDAQRAVARLREGGVPVAKVQVTSALEAPGEALGALLAMDEPRFLHQCVGRLDDGSLIKARDLPEVAADRSRWEECAAVRCHFHVAVFRETFGELSTTRPFLEASIDALAASEECRDWEVETYTWGVTPAANRREVADDDLVSMIVRELRWTAQRLGLTEGEGS